MDSPDYLTRELRETVQRLKTEIRARNTDRSTLRERAGVAWSWANAFALSGGIIPAEMPFFIAAVFLGDRAGTHSVLRRDPDEACVELDQMISELALKDENPHALGELALRSPKVVEVFSWQTLEQSYSFGDMSMKTGGGFLVCKLENADHGDYQWVDPGADNYVSIRANRSGVRFEPTTVPIRGIRGGIRAPREVLFFRLVDGQLEKADSVTLTYGDRSGGGRGLRMPSFTNDALRLPVYVDFDGSANYLSLKCPELEVVGGAIAGLHVFVPATVRVGEPFSVSVRSEDAFRNRASGAIPPYELWLDGVLARRLPNGNSGLQVVRDLVLSEPGVHRFRVQTPDGSMSRESDPIWVRDQGQEHIYFGDIHGHCGLADGLGTPRGYMRFAREDARLDFTSLSEHDVFMDDNRWRELQDTVREYKEEGEFIPILGFECTAPPGMGGHHNVYYRNPEAGYVPLHQALTLTGLHGLLRQQCDSNNVVIVPHAHQAADWRVVDPDLVRLVEIHAQHGSFEWFARKYVDQGYRVGFAGGGDNHQGHPGYSNPRHAITEAPNGLTALLAREKSADALFDAMRDRCAYATTGERMLLEFTVNDEAMGGSARAATLRHIRGRVSGTLPLNRIDVLRCGQAILTRLYGTPLSERCWIRVSFTSSSRVYGFDNPRGYRIWRGSLALHDAQPVAVRAPGLFNRHAEYAGISGTEPGQISFEVHTRGHSDVILVELDKVGTEGRLTVSCEASTEYADSRFVRERQEFPAFDLTIRLADLQHGRVNRPIITEGHCDSVGVEVVNPSGPLDDTIELLDAQEIPGSVDYCMRVEQLDGSLAWTSPVWIEQ